MSLPVKCLFGRFVLGDNWYHAGENAVQIEMALYNIKELVVHENINSTKSGMVSVLFAMV